MLNIMNELDFYITFPPPENQLKIQSGRHWGWIQEMGLASNKSRTSSDGKGPAGTVRIAGFPDCRPAHSDVHVRVLRVGLRL